MNNLSLHQQREDAIARANKLGAYRGKVAEEARAEVRRLTMELMKAERDG